MRNFQNNFRQNIEKNKTFFKHSSRLILLFCVIFLNFTFKGHSQLATSPKENPKDNDLPSIPLNVCDLLNIIESTDIQISYRDNSILELSSIYIVEIHTGNLIYKSGREKTRMKIIKLVPNNHGNSKLIINFIDGSRCIYDLSFIQ